MEKLSLIQLTEEELSEISMIDLTYEILLRKKEAMPFQEIWKEICSILHLSEEEAKERIAQFYTDLNLDGRFLPIGENRWGLQDWYPIEQIEDDFVTTTKKRKKGKKALQLDDDLDMEDYDLELEDDELDYDDLDEFDEEEFDEEDINHEFEDDIDELDDEFDDLDEFNTDEDE